MSTMLPRLFDTPTADVRSGKHAFYFGFAFPFTPLYCDVHCESKRPVLFSSPRIAEFLLSRAKDPSLASYHTTLCARLIFFFFDVVLIVRYVVRQCQNIGRTLLHVYTSWVDHSP